MILSSNDFADGHVIPRELVFGVIDPVRHVALAANRNPHLTWADVPAGTQSFVLICHDPDVPSRGDDVNQEGRSVPASLPRVDFFHWVLADLPATLREIRQGEFSDGVTARGKSGPATSYGARHGINDYTNWFAGDAAMAGDYYGYDGPCPPWNDEIVHRYVFTLFALDLPRLAVGGRFTGQQTRDAMNGHILGQASIGATYSLNPALAKNR